MLLNSYFKIISRTDSVDGVIFSVEMLDCHPVYKGHFPGDPVSPGVCNLQMIKECAELVAGKCLHFTTVSQYRLMEIMSPTKTPLVDISISLANKGDLVTIVASVKAADLLCITIKGELTDN